MGILTVALAVIAIPIAATIASVLTLPLHALEKRLQWAGRSLEEWRSMNVDSPGERLRALSFLVAGLCTTVTRAVAFFSAGAVFHWRGTEMPFGFVIVTGFFLLLNDALRVVRFIGNSGVWTEMGYGAGGLLGLGLGLFLVRHL